MEHRATSEDAARFRRALELFEKESPVDDADAMSTALECLAVPLFERRSDRSGARDDRDWPQLQLAIDEVSRRLTDVFVRLRETQWLHDQRQAEEDDGYGKLAQFLELAIKDFHGDLAGVMDAIAPVVAQTTTNLSSAESRRSPGFADVAGYDQSSRAESFRETVPSDALRVVDATEDWWVPIKRLRQVLMHRRHTRLLFARPEQGFRFQVYDEKHRPLIKDPRLLASEGTNVVDFDVYSTRAVANLLLFVDEVGVAIAPHWDIDLNRRLFVRTGDFEALRSTLSSIIGSGLDF